ncbi:EamA family transporter [Paraferrimonas sp. SM1919]|uniref:EamA family transporter n=1 Tax=Paraferrimonas sp. SM1919 TaxID=2662263 RepID=UPI0013D8BBCE|nr:EamA family transporter [Paraferrimonas sp. SM1919]
MSWLWIVISISCTCMGQVAQKFAVQNIQQNPSWQMWQKLLQPWLLAAIGFLGLGALAWLLVLQQLPVGKAYPLLAINFAVMALVAKFAFKEKLTLTVWLGNGLIIIGVVLLGVGL